MTQKKEQRSNKWAFLLYKESAPEDYLAILDELHVPYVLSPWHDKDVNHSTGEFKKAHKHGALFFESLKSYTQVSDLLTEKLNTPAHVEVVMSPKGMYDYFIHAENPEKTLYNIEDIESGCGFELDKFLAENNPDLLEQVYEIMRDSELKEFADFTDLIAEKYPDLLLYVFEKSYFFKIYLDSKRYIKTERKEDKEKQKNE
ncbi:Plasmid replication protein repB [Lactococcus cremoris subsp. cremoris UC509.9]|uniref:replication protein n=1 Tax=Lactococcus lactis subsp. cremoris TaxID=1359 RepID=UPI00029B7709|nr:replication protein [Lactococcus cremoris]MDY5176280.1 replication protein [Lactococcus lactis]AFW90761.1 Plasmid replication protein repB [Lactococcus cremoris subsp. cremoris UC509.9]ARD90395.1 replication protein [Lactococcus cremoris]MRM68770.1 Replication protein RepB [Lactococcus cremoris]QJD19085.1 Replication protein RepB [Lactococcus cremoris]